MGRFGEYDLHGRLALVGSGLAVAGYVLPIPWFEVGLHLERVRFTGLDLVVAPAVLDAIGTPGLADQGSILTILAGLGLVMALASLLLALAPGVRTLSEFHPEGGFRVAVVGAAASGALYPGFMAFVAPHLGTLAVGAGGVVALAGFALAAFAWPRTQPLGEPDGLEDGAASPTGAPDGPH